MKVILSRKGFDMKHGKIPSPILPDGTVLLLPKPSETGYLRYDELYYNGNSYLDIIRTLDPDAAEELKEARCFPNLDLVANTYHKSDNWKPNYTQYGPSEGHLSSQHISVGDIFLFFGWFRQTRYNENHELVYIDNAPDIHMIFSYLQIGAILKNKNYIYKKYPWQRQATLLTKGSKHYSVYLPTRKLSYNNKQNGYGHLSYSDKLVLTKPGHTCSKWALPDLFRHEDVTITYHNNNTNGFIPGKDYFQSSNIGQEFVVNGTHDLRAWVYDLVYDERIDALDDVAKNILSRVNHINYPDSDGSIYCRRYNKVMKIDSKACKLCQCYHDLIHDDSVECYWTDYLPAPLATCKVEDPDEEYKRVNWLLKRQFLPTFSDKTKAHS